MAKQNGSSSTPKTFAELLRKAQESYAPKATGKAGTVVAQTEDGDVVTISMDSFKGDNGMVYGVRVSGLGGKPLFLTPAKFARLYDDAVVTAAQEFIGATEEVED